MFSLETPKTRTQQQEGLKLELQKQSHMHRFGHSLELCILPKYLGLQFVMFDSSPADTNFISKAFYWECQD